MRSDDEECPIHSFESMPPLMKNSEKALLACFIDITSGQEPSEIFLAQLSVVN